MPDHTGHTNIRALGVALLYALANTLFGGTAEYVALSFNTGGWERGFYWYVTIMVGIFPDRLSAHARYEQGQHDQGRLNRVPSNKMPGAKPGIFYSCCCTVRNRPGLCPIHL